MTEREKKQADQNGREFKAIDELERAAFPGRVKPFVFRTEQFFMTREDAEDLGIVVRGVGLGQQTQEFRLQENGVLPRQRAMTTRRHELDEALESIERDSMEDLMTKTVIAADLGPERDNIPLPGFINLLRDNVSRFEVYYQAEHKEDPEAWPLDLGADEWLQCFMEFVQE